MNAIVPFDFEQTPVRIEDRNGEPWFVLADVCRVLAIANVSDAAARLDDDERGDIALTDTIGRQQSHLAINEAGFYRLVLRSRKPAAQRLTRWVTHDVLPSLRRTGSYGQAAPPTLPRDPRELLAFIAQQAGDMIALQDQAASLAPKAEALDRLTNADGSLAVTHAAKVLGVKPGRLFDWLEEHRWLYRGADGLIGYQAKVDQGLIEHKAHRVDRGLQTPKMVTRALLTPKGLARLAELRAGL